MRSSLLFKLVLLLAVIGILSSGLTGYYVYSANRALLVSAAQATLMGAAKDLNRRLGISVEQTTEDVLMLSRLVQVDRALNMPDGPERERAKDELAQAFASMLALHPEYLQVRLIGSADNGLELVRMDSAGGLTLRVAGDALQEKAHYPYMFDTLALPAGQVYQSAITVNHERSSHDAEGVPSIMLATPLPRHDGQPGGLVVINVDLNKLIGPVRADLPRGYRFYLANSWGDFLVHPDPGQTFGFDRGRRVFMQDSFPAAKPLFEHGANTQVVNGLDQPELAPGSIMAFVRQPFGLGVGNDFLVTGLVEPLDNVLANAQPLGLRIMHIVLACSVIAILLAVIFARALLRPINTLAEAAARFSDTRQHQPLPVERDDEIGLLARNFDSMQRQLHQHMANLYDNQRELDYLAHHDALTGLANRSLFFQRLEQRLAGAEGDQRAFAVLFVDLDRFKDINDRFGHALGDQVLQIVARRLLHGVRSSDVVARLGGDEYLVLLSGIASETALGELLDKLMRSIGEPISVDGVSLNVGASIGYSLYPRDGDNAEDLVNRADHSMYRVKAKHHQTS